MIRPVLHIVLHFLVPVLVAWILPVNDKKRATILMWSTMLVDLDHLLANPIYDPDRNSIGFHPLHTYPMIAVYVLGLIPPKTRIIALGLVIHMALDAIDGFLMHREKMVAPGSA